MQNVSPASTNTGSTQPTKPSGTNVGMFTTNPPTKSTHDEEVNLKKSPSIQAQNESSNSCYNESKTNNSRCMIDQNDQNWRNIIAKKRQEMQ